MRLTTAVRTCALVTLTVLAMAACTPVDETGVGPVGEGSKEGPADGRARVAFGDCSVDPGAPVVFVASGRANQPQPQLTRAERDLVTGLVETGVQVAVVSVSGRPALLSYGSLAPTAKNGPGIDAQEKAAPGLVEAALRTVPGAREADLLGAIDVAARWLGEQAPGGTIVIQDSGVSTAGLLDHTEAGVLTADSAEVAQYLDDVDALPDLSGLTVVFAGLGEVAEPQPAVTPAVRQSLAGQYGAIAEAGGASCVSLGTDPATGPAAAGAPTVTPVDMPAAEVFEPGQVDFALPDSTVGFVPGKAVLRDRAGARAELAAIARVLASTDQPITLTGTTASWGSRAYRRQLSRSRAGIIKALLVEEYGIDGSRITVEGLGSDNRWHVADTDSAGRLLPGPAQLNRSVRIHVGPPV